VATESRDLMTDALLGGGFFAFVVAVPCFLVFSVLHSSAMRRGGEVNVARPRGGNDGVR
jgi:hypothetical protein